MNNAEIIQEAIASVSAMRRQCQEDARLGTSLIEVKQYQSNRFARTYQDLLSDQHFAPATRFFLEDLYGVQDFSTRDHQFSKIAGAIDKLFPANVTAVAVNLAQLHALSEELDLEMAKVWALHQGPLKLNEALYAMCWTKMARTGKRERQLDMTLNIGHELTRLTQTRGLRTLLRLMRRPADLAGLSALQKFLETGFDTFTEMARHESHSKIFLSTIQLREIEFIKCLNEHQVSTYRNADGNQKYK